MNGRRAISGDIGRNRRGAFDGGNWRGVAGLLAAFDVRHGCRIDWRTVATSNG